MTGLFDIEALPVAHSDRTGRKGNRNSARKAVTTSRPPWESWTVKSLPARAVKFISTYCIPAKGHRHAEPLQVAPFQADWLEEILVPGVDASALTLPRGNGKSSFAGAVATWALFDPAVADEFGGQPQIPVVATALKQARRGVYGAAVSYSKSHPDLDDRCIRYTAAGEERITVPFNYDGELFPVADDIDTLQGLDPMLSMIDEVGFISVDAWDSLLLAAGKRPRGLTLGLGTRSPDDSPNALDHLVAQVELHGGIDSFVLVDYHANPDGSIDDEREWRRANPAIDAGFLNIDALRSARKLSPVAAFKTFRLNLKSGSQTGWLGIDGPGHWDATTERVTLSSNEPVYVGIDKSAYNDCSAVALLQRDGGDRWKTKVRIFLPDHGTIDHGEIRDYLRELARDFNVVAFGYDDRYFVEGAQELEREGMPLVKVPQTPARMVPAYSHLYRDIVNHQLIHDDDPQLRGHVLGAVPVIQSTGGFTLAKNKSRHKIDGVVALAIARSLTDLDPAPDDDTFRIY